MENQESGQLCSKVTSKQLTYFSLCMTFILIILLPSGFYPMFFNRDVFIFKHLHA